METRDQASARLREYEQLADELKRENPRAGRIGFAIPSLPTVATPAPYPGPTPLSPAAD